MSFMTEKKTVVAVAVPCYKVREHILSVLSTMPACVHRVYVVDDACPEHSGEFVAQHCQDPRVQVLFHEQNQGVGGAVMTAYRQACRDGVDVVVKVDGDGQMDPALIPQFVRPIESGLADYTKGNRFFKLESLATMPGVRIFGNAVLSFMTKVSTGYWSVMDPTNGYTAIHTRVIALLPLEKIAKRYFFETDMLFRLNTVRAVVKDVPMDAVYGDEVSGLKISRIIPEFLKNHIQRFAKRYFYNYILRDFNMGTLYSLLGVFLLLFGAMFGVWHWWLSDVHNEPATSGTVMLAAMPIMIGIQFLIAFLHIDIHQVAQSPLWVTLMDRSDHTTHVSH